ncbi:ethanolamine utilization protein EutP [Lactonifactor longoviformis]|uniref:Ethanolamine utilization protein EutP n=1 Tax=Lactonifactor longoviformis DSM 17459 TaxID=1122155 RepID=A0A1M4VEG7_9CLOT|nr:EutP/PduV family microcompartment system protein [Lactonifactor longoviformis]POP31596.1 ethanolamine utilization protein EutP [Lactonifactor longoviformis]SHE67298.1 ethanolamine utilization protein EutP [Lactonifactor longoviformis DSM 17459]
MKKVIFMGKTGCGKTTLCQKLHEQELKYKKTQAVERYGDAIDTPGEYLENRHFYNALIMSAIDARMIALVADPTSSYQAIPPGFASIFGKKVIGIITKCREATQEQIQKARGELQAGGAWPIFAVDTPAGVGIPELFDYLEREGKASEGRAAQCRN